MEKSRDFHFQLIFSLYVLDTHCRKVSWDGRLRRHWRMSRRQAATGGTRTCLEMVRGTRIQVQCQILDRGMGEGPRGLEHLVTRHILE
jgi:hypothetical protein